MDLIRRILKFGFLIALFAVAVNDIGRYAQAQYTVGNLARDVAEASAQAARSSGNQADASWRAGETIAQGIGATVYGFKIEDERVHVWVRMPVTGTIVWQRANALIKRQPAATPLLVDEKWQALIQ